LRAFDKRGFTVFPRQGGSPSRERFDARFAIDGAHRNSAKLPPLSCNARISLRARDRALDLPRWRMITGIAEQPGHILLAEARDLYADRSLKAARNSRACAGW